MTLRTQPITIEPGSGLRLAGKKVIAESWRPQEALEIVFVGEEYVLLKTELRTEFSLAIRDEVWHEVLPEPKKKLFAPAVVTNHEGIYYLSAYFYESEQQAKDTLWANFVQWPAIPNKDGFYEVDE